MMAVAETDRHLPHHNGYWVNHSSRKNAEISEIIIHTTEGPSDADEDTDLLKAADNHFHNPDAKASTHLGIQVDGSLIYRWVLDHERAWGARNHNAGALHVELAGYAAESKLVEQVNALADKLVEWLIAYPGITRALVAGGEAGGIKGHGDVDPDRRWDPGVLELPYLVWRIQQVHGVTLGWQARLKRDHFPESMLVHYVQHVVGVYVDGIYGQDTETAVKTWQAQRDLTVDGIFGPISWASHYEEAVDNYGFSGVGPEPRRVPESRPAAGTRKSAGLSIISNESDE